VKAQIEISDYANFDTAFGETGMVVGPRTGSSKRSKDEKEWWVARRFLKAAIPERVFTLSLSIRKGQPPEPDFVLEQGNGSAWLEITEASDEADQKEMTTIEISNESAVLRGTFGGRFKDGASQPGRAWATDVVNAIERKARKTIFSTSGSCRHLVVYPNSNAASLLSDAEGELTAMEYLRDVIFDRRESLVQTTNGCLIHVLGAEYVFFDVVGDIKYIRRI
jgi:hypothetical protein